MESHLDFFGGNRHHFAGSEVVEKLFLESYPVTCKFGGKDGEWSCNCEVFVMNRLLDILMINNHYWSTPWHIWGRVADDFCGSMSSFDVHKVNLTVPFQTWTFSMFFWKPFRGRVSSAHLVSNKEPLVDFYMGFCYPLIFLAVMVIPHSHKTLKLLVFKEKQSKDIHWPWMKFLLPWKLTCFSWTSMVGRCISYWNQPLFRGTC